MLMQRVKGPWRNPSPHDRAQVGSQGREKEEEEELLIDSPVTKTVVVMSASASMGCTTAWKSSRARPEPLCGFSSTSAWQGRGSTP